MPPLTAPQAAEPMVPPVPLSIEQTGLSESLLEHLILKILYFRGEVSGRDLALAMGLRFSVIEHLLDAFKRSQAVQVKSSLGMGPISSQFCLTEVGRGHARECLESHQYSGQAPVPLHQYTHFVRRQRPPEGWLTMSALKNVYRRMVVTDQVLGQIGPAVSSGNSFLIYGQPGNGKSYMAEALANLDQGCIYLPYAIEYQGVIVQVYDPTYHQVMQDEEPISVFSNQLPHDGRWFKCRRPFIVTGGELSMEMLDLSYNETSKVYDAPFQLKANNGIYLIDDFGRQKATPAEILNRWIVPMERRIDYLSLRTGGKITVPFEAFLIFSTNLRPDGLGDEAFLRRIQYKMLVRNPSPQEFEDIFHGFCNSRELPHPPGIARRLLDKYYKDTGKPMRRCHPRDVLSHAIDLINFESLPFELTDELLFRAFESCFVEDPDD
ncbi:MAG: ATP-binding protein [Bryobacteraceae bacterium]